MYGLLATLGIERGKPFTPSETMTGLLDHAAKMGRDQMLVSAFASERSDTRARPDRSWEWVGLIAENGDFETPAGLDLEDRDRWFAQAIVASPAMFRRSEGSGSLYWLGARDSIGADLDGGQTYRLSIPLPVPGKLFWSITLYDAETRSQIQTEQGKAALRSMFELKDLPSSGSGQLHFGPTAPAGDSSAWIQTTTGRAWFAYIRIYDPKCPHSTARGSPETSRSATETRDRSGKPAFAPTGSTGRLCDAGHPGHDELDRPREPE
jgi:hypothetical protein